MILAETQRAARIKEKGEPKLRIEFDVFEDGCVSMWTHFDHNDDFNAVKQRLELIKDHLIGFLADEGMCPFKGISK